MKKFSDCFVSAVNGWKNQACC